ncbi:MAG: class I SAM-dependent methyltransferase [Chloroflexota bacterium]
MAADAPHVDPTGRALARLYDLDAREHRDDLDLYLALARRTRGPILELAVGTARVAIPLAEAGYDVTGVDLDAAMLDRAREAAAASGHAAARRLTLVQADARDVRLPAAGTFRLAYIALNSLLLFDGHDQEAVIATLAAHLATDGIAVVDVLLPDADDLARFDGRLILDWVRRDPDTDRFVTKTSAGVHHAATGVLDLTTIFEEAGQGDAPTRWVRHDQLRLVGSGELVTLLALADLEVETLAGSYELDPMGADSERAVVIARRR